MIAYSTAVVVGFFATVGFARGINRKPGDHISGLEWFLSLGVGVLVAASAFALLR